MRRYGTLLWYFSALLIISSIAISAKKPMWLDELYSYYSTQDSSFSHTLNGIAHGVNAAPPLYFIITWLMYKAGVQDVIFYRIFSSACFILSLFLLWNLLKKYFSENIVAATLIVTFGACSLIVYQNAEFRNYALFFLLETLATFSAVHLIRNPDATKWLLLFTLFVGLSCLTHIFGIFYGIAFLVSFLVFDYRQKQFSYKKYVANLLGLSFIGIWIRGIILQSDIGKPHSWIPVPGMGSFFDTVASFIPFGDTIKYHYLIFISILLAILVFFFVALGPLKKWSMRLLAFRRTIWTSDEKAYIFLLGWSLLLVPTVTAFLLSRLVTSIFFDRYMIPSILGTILLMVCFLSSVKSNYEIAIRVVGYVLIAAGLFRLMFITAKYEDQVSKVFSEVKRRAVNENIGVIFQSPQYFMPFQFYNKSIAAFYPLDWKVAADTGNALSATSDYKSMEKLKYFYNIKGVQPSDDIFRSGKTFLLVDEPEKIWLRHYVDKQKISVLKTYALPNGQELKKIIFK